MIVMDALRVATDHLRAADSGVFSSPMLDAEVLLAFVLDIPRSRIFRRLDVPLSEAHQAHFEDLIRRRALYEPVAYLTGTREFYGRPFAVNHSTLIPRPDTETLIDAALALSAANTLFADIGTGSGAIAVTLAAESGLPVLATDISAEALTVAEANAQSLGVAHLISFHQGEGLDPVLRALSSSNYQLQTTNYKLILCANLPYLPEERWDELQPDIRLYEPKDALLSGTDGLDAYRALFRDLKRHRPLLPPQVSCLIEIDPTQTKAVQNLIRARFLGARVSVRKDLAGHDRVIVVTHI